MRCSNIRVGLHERTQDNAREGEREKSTTREVIRDRAGETYCTGIPKALDTSIAMHYVIVTQQVSMPFCLVSMSLYVCLQVSMSLSVPPCASNRLFASIFSVSLSLFLLASFPHAHSLLFCTFFSNSRMSSSSFNLCLF